MTPSAVPPSEAGVGGDALHEVPAVAFEFLGSVAAGVFLGYR